MSIDNGYSISADKIADYAPVFYNAGRTPLFIGPPGIAKTAFVREAARSLGIARGIPTGLQVRELHLASMSEVDVRGYLIPDGERAVFTKPEFWATVEAHPEGGILFLDEFVQATHEVQKAIAPLVLEGRIGEYQLPPTWRVFLAGNGLQDGAGANSLLTHIVNRVTIVNVTAPDPDNWMVWAAGAGVPSELIAFALAQPVIVFEPDTSQLGPDEPFCTPRSLHATGDLANNFPGGVEGMVNDPVGMAFMAGTIGTPAASALAVFIKMAISLPGYDDVISNPLKTLVPERIDQQYAMVIMLACRAKHEDLEPVMQYLTRFDNNMILTGLAALTRRDKTMTHNAHVLKWILANQELLGKFSRYISKAVRQ